MRFLLASFIVAALLAEPSLASADGAGDGLYGRWDEDLVLSLAAGGAATFGPGGEPAKGAVAGSAGLRFYGAAGPLVAAAWAPGGPDHVFAGVELRPLFPGLFLMDMSTGRAFVDLLLQSLAVELGAAFLVDGDRSVGLGIGVALEVPIVRPDVFSQGLWLRLGMRRIVAPSFYQTVDGPSQSHYVLEAKLVLALGIETGLENAERPRYR